MPLKEGQQFAEYRIVRLLGTGGMGEVYLAQHPRLPRQDALKILPVEVSSDPEYRARFAREAALASTLWHPHVVGVHDRGETDGQLWISMDFVDGLDLSQIMASRHPGGIPATEVSTIITAVAGALDYAHKKGLLHRDVKPANIMLAEDGDHERRILLADFGIARTIDDSGGLTATNMTIGTVAYCAPEQLMGDPVDGRADQYALAATAYHLLCGQTLFPHTNPAVVISRHLTADPPSISALRPGLSSLDSVLSAALSKDPEDRFARCLDFAKAFSEQAIPSSSPVAAPTTPASSRRQSSQPTARRAVSKPAGHQKAETLSAATAPAKRNSDRWGGRFALVSAIVLSVTALVAITAVLIWQPWSSTTNSLSETTSSQTRAPSLMAPPPAATPPLTSQTPAPTAEVTPSTTQPQADPYQYALPACYWQDDPPTERPTAVTFQTCADGSQQLQSMSWSSWSKAGAQGSGIFSFKTCEPNCAEGPRAQYAVNVSAFNPRPAGYNSGCPTNVMFFSELVLSFSAAPPNAYGMTPNTTYLGRPAMQFSTSPGQSGSQSLGNQLCY